MKIVVVGGTGLIGSKLVTNLRAQGHDVTPASRRSGVNTITGEGLADAFGGASVVVDVSNAPSFRDEAAMAFFETSTRNMLAAEAAADVGHHAALSIVGTEQLGASGYFRGKIAQETLIRQSPVPHTIVRATQFFEFLPTIAAKATDGTTVRLPPVLVQPMALDDVAAAVGRVAVGAPLNGIVEIAGPEQFRLDELIRGVLADRHDPREVVADPRARYFGEDLSERTLVPSENAWLGATRFDAWLSKASIAA